MTEEVTPSNRSTPRDTPTRNTSYRRRHKLRTMRSVREVVMATVSFFFIFFAFYLLGSFSLFFFPDSNWMASTMRLGSDALFSVYVSGKKKGRTIPLVIESRPLYITACVYKAAGCCCPGSFPIVLLLYVRLCVCIRETGDRKKKEKSSGDWNNFGTPFTPNARTVDWRCTIKSSERLIQFASKRFYFSSLIFLFFSFFFSVVVVKFHLKIGSSLKYEDNVLTGYRRRTENLSWQ